MKGLTFILAALICLGSLQAQEKPQAPQQRALEEEQAIELVMMLSRQDPFLEGPDVTHAPDTIGLFFNKEIYKGLRGNPFMGYYYEEGGKYIGAKTKTFWIDKIGGVKSTLPWQKVIRSAFEKLAKAKGFIADEKSPNHIGLYAVQVTPEKTKTSHAGIVAEIYIQNREKKTVLYTRQYEGDLKGPESAIVTLCDFVFFQIEHEPKEKKKG